MISCNNEPSHNSSENRGPRLACVFLLDTSGSMRGQPMAEMMSALQDFKEVVLADGLASEQIEVAVVTFGSDVHMAQDFVSVSGLPTFELKAQGEPRVAEAIDRALHMIEARKKEYRDQGILHYRPWTIMITSGKFGVEITDTIGATGARIREEETNRRVTFFVLAVADADMGLLRELSVREPLRLAGFDFRDLSFRGSTPSTKRLDSPDELMMLPPLDWTQA